MFSVQVRDDNNVAIFDNDNPQEGERLVTRRQWDTLMEKAETQEQKDKAGKSRKN
jgi:hypothetical protein